MHHVHRGVRQGECLRGAVPDGHVREPAHPTAGDRGEVAVRLDADDAARLGREQPGRWKPVPQPMSSRSRPSHGARRLHQRGDRPGPVDGAVLDLVDLGVVPDVRAGDGARSEVGIGHPSSALARHRRRSDADESVGGLELGRDDPGGAVRRDPLDLHGLERLRRRTGRATPRHERGRRRSRGTPATPGRWPRRSGAGSGRRPTRRRTAAAGRSAVPARRSASRAARRRPDDAGCPFTASRPSRSSCGADVVDGDDPAEPAAAELGAGAHGLAEGRLVRRRVVEHLDDLEVGAVGQRQDHVAGAEARVDASGRRTVSPRSGASREVVPTSPPGPAANDEVVETHAPILTRRRAHRTPGCRGRPGSPTAGSRTAAVQRRAPNASAGGRRTRPASTSYAASPISAISSVALER